MNLGLQGKSVIVTGGSSHIGREITFAFAAEGANVVVADWDEAQGAKTVEEAKGLGGTAMLIPTDITKPQMVASMVAKTAEKFGGVGVLVNNVGFSHIRPFMTLTDEDIEKELNVNFLGAVSCIRSVLPHMLEAKHGVIINIGSDAGRVGQEREVFYSGTKGAIIALGKGLAKEVGRSGVRVNAVCPGSVPVEDPSHIGEKSVWKSPDAQKFFTPEVYQKVVRYFYPMGRMGKPSDIANAVVFLSSDAASFITGQTLSVSGGYTML